MIPFDGGESISTVLNLDADMAAKSLLGCIIERVIDNHLIRVRIVETEAYDQHDAASHSFKGVTPRTKPMFGPAGISYVYFTYGMHYCFNIVVGEIGHGAAVLIRAVEPLDGIELLERHRPGKYGVALTNGPAKLCQALAIDKRMNGHNMEQKPLRLIMSAPIPSSLITVVTRIGISKESDKLWRFYVTDNPYVSVKKT